MNKSINALYALAEGVIVGLGENYLTELALGEQAVALAPDWYEDPEYFDYHVTEAFCAAAEAAWLAPEYQDEDYQNWCEGLEAGRLEE